MSLDAPIQQTQAAIALKGGMLTLTSIQLFTADLDLIAIQLEEKISQAPNFFLYAPVILDLQPMGKQDLKLALLLPMLKTKKLIPVGVRTTDTAMQNQAIDAGLALFPAGKERSSEKDCDLSKIAQQEPAPPSKKSPTKIITQPVRSGQQIYAQGGDLIVLAPVSHGAELLADGSIHVHGALRGRALAGVMGDHKAVIYCKSLEAELVSIAGQYRVSEDLKTEIWKQSVLIQLEKEKLKLTEM